MCQTNQKRHTERYSDKVRAWIRSFGFRLQFMQFRSSCFELEYSITRCKIELASVRVDPAPRRRKAVPSCGRGPVLVRGDRERSPGRWRGSGVQGVEVGEHACQLQAERRKDMRMLNGGGCAGPGLQVRRRMAGWRAGVARHDGAALHCSASKAAAPRASRRDTAPPLQIMRGLCCGILNRCVLCGCRSSARDNPSTEGGAGLRQQEGGGRRRSEL
jgi:hypothetical protein